MHFTFINALHFIFPSSCHKINYLCAKWFSSTSASKIDLKLGAKKGCMYYFVKCVNSNIAVAIKGNCFPVQFHYLHIPKFRP